MKRFEDGAASGKWHRPEMKVHFSRSFMRKMVASFLLIAFVPLLACLFLSWKNTRIAYQNEMLSLNGSAQKSANRLESALAEADELLTMILRQSDTLDTVTYDGRGAAERLYTFIQTRNFYQMLVSVAGLAGDILIINESEDIAITGHSVNLQLDMFYRQFNQRYPFGDWPRAIQSLSEENSPSRRAYHPVNNEEGRNRAMLYGTVTARRQNNGGLLVALVILPEHLLGEVAIDSQNQYAVMLGDRLIASDIEDEALLASLVNAEETPADGGGARYVACEIALASGFRLVCARPYEAFIASVRPMIKGMLTFVACVFAVSVFLCVFIAYLNSRPLEKLLVTMFGREGENIKRKYNWDAIYETLRKLFMDNLALKTEFNAQTATLKGSLIHELVSNRNCNQRGIGHILSKLGAPVDQPCRSLLIGLLPGGDAEADPIAQSMLLARLTDKHFPGAISSLSVDADRYLVILDASKYTQAQLAQAFTAFSEEAESILQLDLNGIAARVSSLIRVRDAFFTQSMLLDRRGGERGLTLFSEEALPGRAEDVRYPTQLGDSLRSAILEGSREKTFACLEEIEHRNRVDGVPADAKIHKLRDLLYLDIASALLRQDCAEERLVAQTLQDLNALNLTDESRFYFERLRCILEPVLQAIRENARANAPRGTELGAEMIAFLRENITDANLSLTMLAQHFRFSESYVSNIIKNETGIGFAAYCEALRIEIACKRLREGASIQDVAAQTGYNSPHSFRRAFKKVNGVTPSQYLEKAEGEGDSGAPEDTGS